MEWCFSLSAPRPRFDATKSCASDAGPRTADASVGADVLGAGSAASVQGVGPRVFSLARSRRDLCVKSRGDGVKVKRGEATRSRASRRRGPSRAGAPRRRRSRGPELLLRLVPTAAVAWALATAAARSGRGAAAAAAAGSARARRRAPRRPPAWRSASPPAGRPSRGPSCRAPRRS